MTSTDKIDFFIMGSERSGTTVTGVTLDQMPDICAVQATMVTTRLSNLFLMVRNVVSQGGEIDGVSPEQCESLEAFVTMNRVTPFLHQCLFHFCFYENLVNSSRSDITKDVLSQKEYAENMNLERYMARYREGDRTWSTTVAAMYSEFAEASGSTGQIFGEQTPDNALRTEALLALYPSVKFIFMVRHPITGVASLLDRYTDVDYAVRQYRNPFAHFPFDNEEILNRTLFVKFEDMLANRDMVLGQMRAHLALPPIKPRDMSRSHAPKMFSNYVGKSLNMDRYYRSLSKYPVGTRRLILEKNSDIADVFYSAEESERIIGYREAA